LRLIVATVAVFVVVGLLTGGSLRVLSSDRIRWGPLANVRLPGFTLRFLGDVIPVDSPLNQVVSAGDVATYLGVGWFIVATMHRPRDVDDIDVPVLQTEA